MPSQTLPLSVSDIALAELSPVWSRESVTLTGAAVKPGEVLARESGKYAPVDFGGTGSAKVAVAVAIESADATSGDVQTVVLARGAVVDIDTLLWPGGATQAQTTAAIDQLEARGIVARAAL